MMSSIVLVHFLKKSLCSSSQSSRLVCKRLKASSVSTGLYWSINKSPFHESLTLHKWSGVILIITSAILDKIVMGLPMKRTHKFVDQQTSVSPAQ